MAKNFPTKKINRSKHLDFIKVANSFREGAELAKEFGYYNPAGVLIIHSAIAYMDAITIKYAGEKSKGDSHYDVMSLVKKVVNQKQINNTALNNFKNLIDHKSIISYSGDIYYKKDIDKLFKHYDRFANWAKDILE